MQEKIEKLEQLINYHDNKYWVLNEPEISDYEYDKLIEQLKELDPNNSLITKLNTSVENLDKITHSEQMLSLDKKYSWQELIEWCKSVSRNNNEVFEIQPKFDGWSGQVTNGILYTRGDDGIGVNISNKIPLMLADFNSYTHKLSDVIINNDLRGEIIMRKSIFKKYKDKILRSDNKSTYKTERSILAGLLRTHKTDLNYSGLLSFMVYETFTKNFTLDKLLNLSDMHWESIINNFKHADFPADGLVIKLADKNYSKSLGNTSHHPRGEMALKFGNPTGITIIKNVEWQIGKKNTLTPVAILEPVDIIGHTITKANLHNLDQIDRLNIKINDKILIERCGEIIPNIVKVLETYEYSIPINIEKCPVCNSKVSIDRPFIYCSNPDCNGSNSKRLYDSCVRIGLENIGLATVEKIVREYNIDNIWDLLNLEYNEILILPGFAETSATKLYEEFNRVKGTPIEEWRILSSLNLVGIGDTLSKQLLENNTLYELMIYEYEQFLNIPNMGPERASVLYNGLYKYDYLLNDLLDNLPIKKVNNKSNGKICFTGKMPEVRSYYENLALKNNLTPVDTITKDLTYLVCQDINGSSSKLVKARKLGINIISLSDFLTNCKILKTPTNI